MSNPLGLAVLAYLLMEPMHPYEIGRRLKEHGKDRNINYNPGSLYTVVEKLAKAGFITKQESVRDTQRPERTPYALSDRGRQELFDWLGELVAQPQQEYPLFGVALSLLSVLPPGEAVELLKRRLTALSHEIDAVRALVQGASDGGVHWLFLVEEDYRLAVLEAEHSFVERLIESLSQPEHLRAWQEIFGGDQ